MTDLKQEMLDLAKAMPVLKGTLERWVVELDKEKAGSVREAKMIITSGAIEKTHKHMIIEGGYCYVSNRSLDEYADKLENQK